MARAATTTDVFNAIAERRRREMIRLIGDGREWTVGEIADQMRIAQPVVSKHIHVLKKVGIVTVMKRGRFRCYRLNPASLQPILELAGFCKVRT
ncbi:ArsR/SmtB family transcription factor [Terriglobus sp. 2YAB30_2]|uniref:ArsR/SmtB family transcription factor n=1 Tax=unclassified Terriglobus TaxID=2628988 RepID=UPI003F97E10D